MLVQLPWADGGLAGTSVGEAVPSGLRDPGTLESRRAAGAGRFCERAAKRTDWVTGSVSGARSHVQKRKAGRARLPGRAWFGNPPCPEPANASSRSGRRGRGAWWGEHVPEPLCWRPAAFASFEPVRTRNRPLAAGRGPTDAGSVPLGAPTRFQSRQLQRVTTRPARPGPSRTSPATSRVPPGAEPRPRRVTRPSKTSSRRPRTSRRRDETAERTRGSASSCSRWWRRSCCTCSRRRCAP